MTDDIKNERNAQSVRNERLKSALRDNLKRRKSQARGRAGTAIVTPDDDARTRNEILSSQISSDTTDRGG